MNGKTPNDAASGGSGLLENDFTYNPFTLGEEDEKNESVQRHGGAGKAALVPLIKGEANLEAELARRERELNEQARTLQEREEQLRRLGATIDQLPNWPICYPLVHHDIQQDILSDYAQTIQWLYYYWYFVQLTLVTNAIAACLILMSGVQSVTTGGTDFGLSLLNVLVVLPLSFFSWYRAAYSAHRPHKSAYFYFLFFGFFSVHLLFCSYMSIGIPGTGGAGLINMLSMFAAGKTLTSGILVVSTVCWFLSVLLGIVFLKWTHMHYRSQGHTLQGAKNGAPGIGMVLKSLFSG
jgi:hypothetical protein